MKLYRSLLALLAILPSALLADSGDACARPLKTPMPVHPVNLKRNGVTGSVVVRVFVNDVGAVTSCEIARSTNPEFNRCALDAVGKWRFRPAQKDGVSVASTVLVPITFLLD